MRALPNLTRPLQAGLLALFILFNLLNLQAGWADNGDFERLTRWFSSGPAFLADTAPVHGTPAWDQRYLSYWMPYWVLDFPMQAQLFVSAMLLWLPGILINRFLYSRSVLWAPLASLGARLALLALLAWLLGWIGRRSPHPWLHILGLGLPLVLLFTTSDVAAFYNSFYQETGTLVFLPLVLGVIVWGFNRRRDARFYAVYLAAMLLLTLSKTACFFWPVLALPFVVSGQQVRSRPRRYLPLAAILVALPLAAGLVLTHVPSSGPARPYNALYSGVLLLSDAPQQRLAELGLAHTSACIGLDWYPPAGGAACVQGDWERIDYLAVGRVMLAEPQIMLRQAELLAASFQNMHLELGKYAQADILERAEDRLNFWALLQEQAFPRGAGLLLASLVLAAGIAWTWKKEGLPGDLARLGLICLLGMWVDSFVQLWGDGQRDLLKHLFIPNILFDFAWLAVVNACLAVLPGRRAVLKDATR